MAIEITSNMEEAQNSGGNREYYVFLSGISNTLTDNFESSLISTISESSTIVQISGNHTYMGYMSINSEIVEVLGSSYVGGNTEITIKKKCF